MNATTDHRRNAARRTAWCLAGVAALVYTLFLFSAVFAR
jgi:hypothetical protein